MVIARCFARIYGDVPLVRRFSLAENLELDYEKFVLKHNALEQNFGVIFYPVPVIKVGLYLVCARIGMKGRSGGKIDFAKNFMP